MWVVRSPITLADREILPQGDTLGWGKTSTGLRTQHVGVMWVTFSMHVLWGLLGSGQLIDFHVIYMST